MSTPLLHQMWKDLYDMGIELQYSFGTFLSWYIVNRRQTVECLSFNSVNYKYRINPNNEVTRKMYITKDNITFDEVLGFDKVGWYLVAGDKGKRHCNPIYYTLSILDEIKDTTMYEYLPIEQVKVGDVVQFINNEYYRNIPTDSLHIVDSVTAFNSIRCNTVSGTTLQSNRFKLIKTKPGTEAKTGDMIIRFKGGTSTMPTGGIFKAQRIMPTHIYYATGLSANNSECLVLCTASERNIKPKPDFDVQQPMFCATNESHTCRHFIHKGNCIGCNKYIQQTIKEDPMSKTILDLMFLSELMKMSTQEEQKDATNSNLVAIMIDKNSKYIGYFYANTDDEVKEIAAKPENEGNKICVFEYKTTFSQKPRKVIEVGRD